MPITYTIDREQRLIIQRFIGDVTAAELGQHWNELLGNAEAMSLARSIADLRGARLLFTGQELQQLIASIVVPGLKGRSWKSAIVVDAPLLYGVSRQYQSFAESYSQDAIFHDLEAANRWLRADGPPENESPSSIR